MAGTASKSRERAPGELSAESIEAIGPAMTRPGLVEVAREERRAFFTQKTLGEFLSVSPRTVRDWLQRGLLSHYRIEGSVRIDPADVDSFLAQRREERSAAA